VDNADNECISLILGGSYAAAVWLLNQEHRNQEQAALPSEFQQQHQNSLRISCHVHRRDFSNDQDWDYQFQHVKLKFLYSESRTIDFKGIAVGLQAARAYQAALLKELNKKGALNRQRKQLNQGGLAQYIASAEGTGEWEDRVKYWEGVFKYKRLGTGATHLLAVVEDCLVRSSLPCIFLVNNLYTPRCPLFTPENFRFVFPKYPHDEVVSVGDSQTFRLYSTVLTSRTGRQLLREAQHLVAR
jgi:hypothetical protein